MSLTMPAFFPALPQNPRFHILSGQRFNRLLVHGYSRKDKKHSWWWCRCDCGEVVETTAAHLKSGHTGSCGCLMREAASASATKHGRYHDPIRGSYRSMVARCQNPNSSPYQYYGGRGITVCDRWLNGDGNRSGFQCFIADMGDRPAGMSLDRKDPEGNYEPGNCRWATDSAQGRNKRNNRTVIVRGETMVLADACERFGVNYHTAHMRLRRGWSDAQALGVEL